MPKKKAEHLPAKRKAVVDEMALEPYAMGQPYDLSLRINQGRWLLRQEVGIRFALGCILMEIHQREDFQTFGKIISEEFGGMEKSTAYNYMAFAKKCIDLPKLKTFAEDNWSKAITLLNSCTDEQLKEIEDKGLDGKALDAYDGMSVREFKQRIAELSEENTKAEAKGRSGAKTEIKMLKDEVSRLREQIPQPGDNTWANKPLSKMMEHLHYFMNELNAFAFHPQIIGNVELKATVEGHYQTAYRAFTEFMHKWEEYAGYKVGK